MRRQDVLSELQQDIRYALRTLQRNARVTALIVIALGIGIGANTAIFTLVDAVLLRTLPVSDADQLVAIGDPARVNSLSQGTPRTDLLSAPLYRDLRNGNGLFRGVLATGRSGRLDVRVERGITELEHPRGRFVSGNYFAVLGVRAGQGRLFDSTMDATPGSPAVAVISHSYWTRRFQNELSVIGQRILVNGTTMTIIGVAPPSFIGEIVGASTDVWLPLTMSDVLRPHQPLLSNRSANWLLALGRLKPNATLAQVKQQLPLLIERSVVEHGTPAEARAFLGRRRTYYIASGARGLSSLRSTFHTPLLTLMAGVALLLAIICVNIANLLLGRALARAREMAVRLALGANRARLVRQLMTESALLTAISATAGLAVSWLGSRALLMLAADGGTIPLDISIDRRILAFTIAVSVLAVGVFGLAPALRASRVDVAFAIRSNAAAVIGNTGSRRHQYVPLGRLLIAGQVALSVVLLVGAAMLVRSLRAVESLDTGMDRDHLLLVALDVNGRGYRGAALMHATRMLRDRIAAVPGVSAVAVTANGIFSGTESGTTVQVPGFAPRAPEDTMISYDMVGAGYARAIGARIVAGRDLNSADEDRAPRTAVVNQALAAFYFGTSSAVGRFFRINDSVAVQIVGVMADTKDHDLLGPPSRRAYFPYLHAEDALNLGAPETLVLAVRSAGRPATLMPAIRKAVMSADPDLVVESAQPLTHLMGETINQERLVARLASGFGVLALELAAMGLYGVMMYAVTRRIGEIGLRVALGANRSDIVHMVLREALGLVAIGVIIGLPLALGAARLLRTQLHDVPLVDPWSILVAVAVLAVTAAFAAALPAVRASRVSPLVALNAD